MVEYGLAALSREDEIMEYMILAVLFFISFMLVRFTVEVQDVTRELISIRDQIRKMTK